MTKTLLAVPALGLALVLGGCAKDRHEAIPPSANLVANAEGDISYTAPQDGEDKIRIESQVVSTDDLKEGDKHRVFFKPSSTESSANLASDSAGTVVREEQTTTVKEADPAPQQKTVTETTETTTSDGDKIIVKEKKTTETQP